MKMENFMLQGQFGQDVENCFNIETYISKEKEKATQNCRKERVGCGISLHNLRMECRWCST